MRCFGQQTLHGPLYFHHLFVLQIGSFKTGVDDLGPSIFSTLACQRSLLLQTTLDFDPMLSDSYDLCLWYGWDNASVATQKDRVRSGRPAVRSMAVKQ